MIVVKAILHWDKVSIILALPAFGLNFYLDLNLIQAGIIYLMTNNCNVTLKSLAYGQAITTNQER